MGEPRIYLHYFFTDIVLYSTVLHPRHKLNYFLKAKWESEWINTAQELVQDEFRRNYKSIEVIKEVANKNNTNVQSVRSTSTRCIQIQTLIYCMSQTRMCY